MGGVALTTDTYRINLEFANLLLSKGCNVVFADLKLTQDAQHIIDAHDGKAGGPRALFAPTDVTDWGQLARTFDVCNSEFGGVDLVCPGAGVFEPKWSNFWHPPGVPDSPSKDPFSGLGHYASLDINLLHPIRMTQLAISWFLNPLNGQRASPQNPKRVVCIASIASEIAFPAAPLYVATKWGVSGFVR
jgi:NAD(P)-dependent dehydrogenase (short-subunit alcohol dehydrogenase family)